MAATAQPTETVDTIEAIKALPLGTIYSVYGETYMVFSEMFTTVTAHISRNGLGKTTPLNDLPAGQTEPVKVLLLGTEIN